MRQSGEKVLQFFFPEDNGLWVTALRIGLGIQIVLYVVSLKDDWNFLFGGPASGLIDREFSEALLARTSPLVPQLSWLVSLGGIAGLAGDTVLAIAWWSLLIAGGALCVGVVTRAAAIVAWFLHLCVASSGSLVSYGVDAFMAIGLFYLMVSPLPDAWAIERRWQQPVQNRHVLGFWRRVLQIHLCFIYFFGGLSKALGSGWWNGTNIWRALTRSPFNLLSPELLISWKYVLPVVGFAVWLLEISYPFLIWHKRTRPIWLISIIAMHVGVGTLMGMYLFALIMIVLNLAAFGPGVFKMRIRTRDRDSCRGLPDHEIVQHLAGSSHSELHDRGVIDKSDEGRFVGN